MGKNWYKPKGYTHISKKLGIADATFVNSYVSNPLSVTIHNFFPLIHRTIVEKKYKIIKKIEGKNIRSHHKVEGGKKKTTAKFREIFYSNHLDAHIYSYYTQKILSPLYEKILSDEPKLDQAILAYRRIELECKTRCKCNIDFANDIFEIIKCLKGDYTVLAFDISKFFDSLNHKQLKQKWCQLLGRKDLPNDHYKVYKSLINFSYIELESLLKEFGFRHPNQLIQKDIAYIIKNGKEFRERIKSKGLLKKNPFRHKETKEMMGIPQGTPISAFLANIYMIDYDREIIDFLAPFNGIYRRYSDDILVICESNKVNEVEKKVMEAIEKYKLIIQPEKTQKTRFINGRLHQYQQPVKYLGFEFDGVHKKLKSSSISKYYRNLKGLIKFKALRAKKMKKKKAERAFIYKKQIYKSYSHLGAATGSNRKRNYLSYVNLAAKVMNDSKIKKQLSKSWPTIHNEIVRQTEKHKLYIP